MAEHGLADAVKLASNEVSFAPLPSVRAALAAATDRINRYPDHLSLAVRQRLADRIGVERDQVAVGCGSVGLLQQLALVYAEPGTEVATCWVSFEAYPIYTQLVGADFVTRPLVRHNYDVDALIGSLTERTRLVLVASPNNPTGTVVRDEELVRLADALPAGCLLVVDEAYREFVTGAAVPDAHALLGDRPNVAVLRTFSKAYGLAALRIGYLIGSDEVVGTVDKALVPFTVNGLAQVGALASLDAVDELEDRVATIVAERARVAEELWSLGLAVPDAQANFVWLPAGDRAADLALALEQQGVVTRPFGGLGVRVTIGTPAENDRFLAAFAPTVGALDLPSSWSLATGATAAAAAARLRRLDEAVMRFDLHAVASHHGNPGSAGDPRSWSADQVWAHVGESLAYWVGQVDRLLAAPGASVGRPAEDPTRLRAIEPAASVPLAARAADLARAADRLQARLRSLSDADWATPAQHHDRGQLDLATLVDRCVLDHLAEHAAQLDQLAGR